MDRHDQRHQPTKASLKLGHLGRLLTSMRIYGPAQLADLTSAQINLGCRRAASVEKAAAWLCSDSSTSTIAESPCLFWVPIMLDGKFRSQRGGTFCSRNATPYTCIQSYEIRIEFCLLYIFSMSPRCAMYRYGVGSKVIGRDWIPTASEDQPSRLGSQAGESITTVHDACFRRWATFGSL